MVDIHDKFNDNSINGLDHELSASVKKILLQRIVFKEAQVPDEGDVLNHKYKPLNASYNPHQVKLTLKNNLCNKNSAGIPNPPTVIYPVEKVELQWKGIQRIGPGLANLGNTCFLNSVLQVLTYTPPLVNYILSDYHKTKCKTVGFCMQCELSNHINKVLRHGHVGAVRPMSIIQKLQCIGKNFRFGRQEDAHEFLRYVVEGIQKSDYANGAKLDKLSKETTVANAIFGGYYRSQVKCLHCHYESNTFDPMMDLNLDTKDCSSIIQALQRSTRPDRLDGENKYFCEKCRTKRVAQKRGNIHKEPNVLTLQLKRFDFSKMFGGKICKEISFPEDLNIRPYMSIPQGEPMFYKLYSILVHSGYSCNSGHYYCYVKAPNGMWYEMNDNRVCQVGLQTVLRAQAYILFYVKNCQKKKTNVQTVSKGNIVKNDIQRPEPKSCVIPKPCTIPKPCAISNLDKRQPVVNPLGILLKRKSEPKINWTQNKKVPIKNAEDALLIPSNKTNIEKANANGTKEKSEGKSGKLPLPFNLKDRKETSKEVSLNGLEKLNESYGDSDSPTSGAPSPASKVEDVKYSKDEKNKVQTDHSEHPILDDTNPEKQTGHSSNTKNELLESKIAPFKLKLKNGKQFIHNKLNIWSPITKGTLYPRAIVNRSIFENEADHKASPIVKKKVLDLSWKEEKISNPEKLFGPLMPPPPGTKCQGSNSITSEASSTGSIQTQSGEWDVLDKDCDVSTPASIQPVGWKVHTPCDSSKTMDAEIQPIPVEIEDRKSKKKKKKKKKHKHREDFITEQIVNRKLDRSIDDFSSREEYLHDNINKLEHIERYEHNKKKARKEKLKIQSSLIIPYSTAIPIISEAENIRHKKKKKKHKRKYTLLIDTSSNDMGRLYKFPSSIEEQLSKYEINPSGKQHILLNNSYSKNDACKSYHDNVVNSFDNPAFNRSKSHSVTPNREDRTDNPAFNRSKSHSATPIREDRIDNPAFNRPKSHSVTPNRDDRTQEDLNNKDENRFTRKREIPSHMWDDQKKKVCSWDGSAKSDTVDYLLSGGTKVKSWDDCDNSSLYNAKNRCNGEVAADEWDEEYDKGKSRKRRLLDNEHQNDYQKSKLNSFQHLQNYKNQSKDIYATHRPINNQYTDRHYPNKKRKLYSDDGRFL